MCRYRFGVGCQHSAVSCSGVASAGRVGASQAISDVTDSVVDNVGLPEANASGEAKTEPNEQEADDATGKENTESGARDESANRGEAGSPQGSAADLQRQESASESKGNLAAPPQNTAQRHGWRTRSASGQSIRKPGPKAFPFMAQ